MRLIFEIQCGLRLNTKLEEERRNFIKQLKLKMGEVEFYMELDFVMVLQKLGR